MKKSLIFGIILIFILVVVGTVLGLYFGGVFSKKGGSSSPPAGPTSSPSSPTSSPSSPTSSPSSPTSSPSGPTSSPSGPTSSPSGPTLSPGCYPKPTLAPLPGPSSTPNSNCVNNPSGIIPEGTYQDINPNVTIYRPKVACTPVTCLSMYGGQCQSDGSCKYPADANGKVFNPLIDYPHAMATNYCGLEDGGCSGALGDPRDFINNVKKCILKGNSPETPPNGPIDENTRFGVTANPPIMIGDSNESYDLVAGARVKTSYQGSTPYSGICYDVTGPTGRAILVPYDRCAGYCKSGCGKTSANFKNKKKENFQDNKKKSANLKSKDQPIGNTECGICLQSPDFHPKPNCPCVGKTPLDGQCCGKSDYGCGDLDGQCDWCASQNHPHFDLDNGTFNTVCQGDAGALGSCELTSVKPFKCIVPQKMPSAVTDYIPCPTNSWDTGCYGTGDLTRCDSKKFLKPKDKDWPDSDNADHWCCVAGGGGGNDTLKCPSNSWPTSTIGPEGQPPTDNCYGDKYYKPGDPAWPNSADANFWCCIMGNNSLPCPTNSWATPTTSPDSSCYSDKYYKPGDPGWPDSSDANHWCCISSESKNEKETQYNNLTKK